MKNVVGLFESAREASRAVDDLFRLGYGRNDITVLAREGTVEVRHVQHAKVGMGAARGAKQGAVAGGLIGLLAGVGVLALPGLGPVLAVGPLVTALGSALGGAATGASLGAATGGLIGALVGLGITEEEAHVYAEGVRRGGILVATQVREYDVGAALELFERSGVIDLEAYRTKWEEEGWRGFSEENEVPERYVSLRSRH